MSVKFFENALNALKKANQARKFILAGKAGYSSVDGYEKFLTSMLGIEVTNESLQEVNIEKPIVYVFDVIDCSGSMSGEKLKSAIKGINDGVVEMKKETKVRYRYTLCDFSDRNDIHFTEVADIENVNPVKFNERGMTALNDAIVLSIEKALRYRYEDEKILINIYTDGCENNSKRSNDEVKELISKVKKEGVTVTFIGTEDDTKNVINVLNINASNTVSYDGSAEGLAMTFMATQSARSIYAENVALGKDVSKGFYKEIKK